MAPRLSPFGLWQATMDFREDRVRVVLDPEGRVAAVQRG
jgi:hypothetical protein